MTRLIGTLFIILGLTAACPPAATAIDLIPDIFKKTKINSSVWNDQEQYVALGPQGEEHTSYPPNNHPTTIKPGDLQDALSSLELWAQGGFFRNEETAPLFTREQSQVLGRYVAEALMKAKPDEDVIFNVRGYGSVALDTLKEKEWTSGRFFFVDGKLNLIIGSYQIKKDRGVRNAEAAHGILNNFDDVYFDPGSRDTKSKMPGRVTSTAGVSMLGGEQGTRTDWILIDVPQAVAQYRDNLVPQAEKERNAKVRAEAAKLTLERREMREEMARLRQELKQLKGGTMDPRTVEDRLAQLKQLKDKDLITEEEFKRRRDEILKEI